MKRKRRIKCPTCKGQGFRLHYVDLYYSKQLVCIPCGGTGVIEKDV